MRDEVAQAIRNEFGKFGVYPLPAGEARVKQTSQRYADAAITTVLEYLAREAEGIKVHHDGSITFGEEAYDDVADWLRAMATEGVAGE